MNKFLRRLYSAAAVACAFSSAPGHATVITFDSMAPNLFFPGESFVESGYRLTADFDFGTVDTAASLGVNGPSGNATQFYFNSNDGALVLQPVFGHRFSLNAFSAAFVPQDPASTLATVIVAFATDIRNAQFGTAFLFAPAVNGAYPFSTYNAPADFGRFRDLVSVEFFACSLVNNQLCTTGTRDSGQFAIDNINVTLPEPGTWALTFAALGMLAFKTRRAVR